MIGQPSNRAGEYSVYFPGEIAIDLALGGYIAVFPHPAALIPWIVFRTAAYVGRGDRGSSLHGIIGPLAAYCSWLLFLAGPSMGGNHPDVLVTYAVAAAFLAMTSAAGISNTLFNAPAQCRKSLSAILFAGVSGAAVLIALGIGWRLILKSFSDGAPLPEHIVFSGTCDPTALFFVTCLLVPLGEEFFFRGYLIDSLFRMVGPISVAMISAAAFSAVHTPEHFPGVFISGLILCHIRLRDRDNGLAAAITAHVLNNTVFLVFFSNSAVVDGL